MRPMPIAATVDLIAQYLGQMQEKTKNKDFRMPIEFKDADGAVVACFKSSEIAGLARGEPVDPEQLKKQGIQIDGRN